MIAPDQFLQMEDEDDENDNNRIPTGSGGRPIIASSSQHHHDQMPDLFENSDDDHHYHHQQQHSRARYPPQSVPSSIPSHMLYGHAQPMVQHHHHQQQQPMYYAHAPQHHQPQQMMMMSPMVMQQQPQQLHSRYRIYDPTSGGQMAPPPVHYEEVDGGQPVDERFVQQQSPTKKPTSSSSSGKNRRNSNEERMGNVNIAVPNVAAAQQVTIERIGTPEGWTKMNSWLKTAERAHNWACLQNLLQQCLQAPITLDLMTKNDTPKFVRRLSKSCPDSDTKKLASDVVALWKHDVIGSQAQTSSSSSMATAASAAPPAQLPQRIAKRPSMDTIGSGGTGGSLFDRLAGNNGDEKPPPEKRKKEQRPRTAKTYPAKFRSTGLENEPETTAVGVRRPLDNKHPGPLSKLPTIPKKATPSKAAPVAAEPTSPTLTALPLTSSPSSTPVSATSPTTAAAPPPPLPAKRVILESAGFMAALHDQAAGKKTIKVIKKKPLPMVVKSITVPATNEPTTLLATGGLYSDTTRRNSDTGVPKEEAAVTEPSTSSSSLPVTEESGVEPNRRRVRFADEHGMQLVFIKNFQVEEGERVNVNKLMTSEDMKHFEMQRERSFMAQQKYTGTHPSAAAPMKPVEMKVWRLPRFDGLAELVEGGRGVNSKERDIEARRQTLVMEAFYDGVRTPDVVLEPDDFDHRRDHIPKLIPVEEVIEASEISSPSVNPAVSSDVTQSPSSSALPTELQQLMDGLRTRGMVTSTASSAVAGISIPSGLAASIAAVSAIRPIGPPIANDIQANPLNLPYPAMQTAMPSLPPGTTNVIRPGIMANPLPYQHGYQQQPFGVGGPMTGLLPGAGGIRQGHPLLPVPMNPMGQQPATGRQMGLLVGPPPQQSIPYGLPLDKAGQMNMPSGGPMMPGMNTGGFGMGQQHQPMDRLRQCPFYLAGKCKYGDKCKYSHADFPPAQLPIDPVATGGPEIPATRRELFDRRQAAGADDHRSTSRGGGGGSYDRRRRPSPPRRGSYSASSSSTKDRRFPPGYGRRDSRRSRRSRSKTRSKSRSRSRSPARRSSPSRSAAADSTTNPTDPSVRNSPRENTEKQNSGDPANSSSSSLELLSS